jgi:hypothetical protein
MKKFLLISNVVLFIAVIVLFILVLSFKVNLHRKFPLAKRDTLNAHNLPIATSMSIHCC